MIDNSANSESKPAGYTRREILKIAGKIGAGVALSPIITILSGCDSAIPESKSSQRDFLAEIKLAMETAGNKPLTFEQARNLVPHIIRLFAASGSIQKPTDLERKVFIVRADPKTEYEYLVNLPENDPRSSQVLQYPTNKQLLEDYPYVNFGRRASFISHENTYSVLGAIENNQAFIFLGNTNQKSGGSGPSGITLARKTRFNKVDQDQQSQDEATPFDIFISTTLHELGHLEEGSEHLPLDQEIIIANQQLCQKRGSDCKNYSYGEKDGFIITFKSDDEKESWQTNNMLEEEIREYLATKALLNHGLFASGPLNRSIHVANYEKLISQVGISDQQLFQFNREAQVKEFMLKIARGASGVSFTDNQTALNFAFELFAEAYDSGRTSVNDGQDWEKVFKPHFPELDTNYD